MAKPVGIAKSDSIDKIGSSKSFESSIAAKQYFSNVKSFLKNSCQRIKDKDGNNLSLYVYLDPKYKKTGELKGFKPTNAEFIKEEKK
ncbi:MAG: hypothetical protein LUH11_00590 [Candidatus Gastranaerophilales bacterium]|nr:hypothetical protein [Candidatus Gastranaerophilales bacterium]